MKITHSKKYVQSKQLTAQVFPLNPLIATITPCATKGVTSSPNIECRNRDRKMFNAWVRASMMLTPSLFGSDKPKILNSSLSTETPVSGRMSGLFSVLTQSLVISARFRRVTIDFWKQLELLPTCSSVVTNACNRKQSNLLVKY